MCFLFTATSRRSWTAVYVISLITLHTVSTVMFVDLCLRKTNFSSLSFSVQICCRKYDLDFRSLVVFPLDWCFGLCSLITDFGGFVFVPYWFLESFKLSHFYTYILIFLTINNLPSYICQHLIVLWMLYYIFIVISFLYVCFVTINN